jgi:hypothetical protein
MADLHLFANRPSLVRLQNVETLVAASTDGGNARAETLGRLGLLDQALTGERDVIEAMGVRIGRRPPVPTPTTLQDLVRSGRRRLERERLGRQRTWASDRAGAVLRLRRALQPMT